MKNKKIIHGSIEKSESEEYKENLRNMYTKAINKKTGEAITIDEFIYRVESEALKYHDNFSNWVSYNEEYELEK